MSDVATSPATYASLAALIACLLVAAPKSEGFYSEACEGLSLADKITNKCKLTKEEKKERKKTCMGLKDETERAAWKCKDTWRKKKKNKSRDVADDEEEEEEDVEEEEDLEYDYAYDEPVEEEVSSSSEILGFSRWTVIIFCVVVAASLGGLFLYMRRQADL